jgi:hypothetical protein
MSRWKSGLCALGLWLGLGCGADDLPETDDGQELASQTDALLGETYFAARPDLRRCAAPRCGGSFVRALNREQTTCADGRSAPECYVANLDLSALTLPTPREEQLIREQRKVVFVGSIQPTTKLPRALGSLVVHEAWRGVNDVAAAATLRTTNSGIVCITTPCPTHLGELVNRGRRFSLSPDFSGLKASDKDLDRVHKAIDGMGALLSGRLDTSSGRLATIAVTQAYLRVAGLPRCGVRGLPACAAGAYCQFEHGACGELDHPGVCTPRPTVCLDIYKPVCGCDGQTYGNACEAASQGVSVDREGACEPPEEVVCGGIVGRPCPGAGECRIDTGCPAGRNDCPVCADCTGVCHCSGAAVLCGPGTRFDDSPNVCSCVPAAPPSK